MRTLAALVLLLCACVASSSAQTPAVTQGATVIDGHFVRYTIARLDDVRVQVALGNGHVGGTQTLAGMANHYHALAAINGGFFDVHDPHRIKNLIHTTIVDGILVFKGDVGSILYFDRENHATIDRIPLRIEGSLDGDFAYPNNWYAYWFNRLPGRASAQTITIFTGAWGDRTHVSGGPQVQVTDGVVTAINYASTVIPQGGYVIYFRGETEVASRFAVGRRVNYRVVRSDGNDLGAFSNAWQAIGSGPELLVGGRLFADAAAEGFTDPKVYGYAPRSMVGVSQDQSELIFATSSGTLAQMGAIMKRLGAYNAMNLDGGASSGLWVGGRYLTTPGRRIADALLVLPEER